MLGDINTYWQLSPSLLLEMCRRNFGGKDHSDLGLGEKGVD